ncbi:S9 family peptidase [Caldalkalibacillus salinus]|uniref:S9 family peptidase n=1 Tax=Caldalkalibacillus salinus TaxID=2803787 RepID=UPI0019206B51|nr:S9 family peptidase [Caldalkalibacillus salinus]
MITFNKPDVEQFFRTYGIQTFAVSPDESQVVFSTNLSGKYNLWSMNLPHQFPQPLTFIDQSCQALTFDKNGRYMIAGFDQDGDENTQLYALPPQGGTLQPVRTKQGYRHMEPQLSKDGQRLYYTSNKDNEVYLNVYVYDLEKDEESRLIEGTEAATTLVEVGPEESSYLYSKHFANTYSLMYVRHKGEDILLTPPTDQQHTVSDATFISEHDIYMVTNYHADTSYLAKYDLQTQSFSKVIDIEGISLSTVHYDQTHQHLYLIGAKGVEDRLYQYDLNTGENNSIDSPTSVIEKLVVSEKGNLYLLGRNATRPHNIYTKPHNATEWSPLTAYEVPGVPENTLVEPEILKYPSFDGMEIEALFFKAKEDVNNGHVILWPHGGPQSAERKWFRALFQFLVNRGYSIFAPNFRGSSQYGLKFMKMVEGDWGHGPRLDNVEGLEYIIKQGYADRDKILLMGGSYGGYMALLLHGRHADYFKAVVDIFGVSDLFSFVDSVPEHWKPIMKQWVGDPVEDRERFIKDSPITYVDMMTKPMLVIQGAKDPRVVKAESDKVVEALNKNGTAISYMVLEDEGHGFSKKENEMKVYRAVLDFFDQFIE